MKKIKSYLETINKDIDNTYTSKLRKYAIDNKVPIINKEGLALLKQIITIKNAKNILEIGTAIGYSSLSMSSIDKDIKITTIERNEDMYNQALNNINNSDYKDQITLIKGDALEVDETKLDKFDLIFIDAAKAQYIKFFEKYENNLSDNGIIFTDNLIFHNLIIEEIKDKNLRQLVTKIKRFNDWLINNENYNTYIYEVGDGVAISIRK